MRAAGAERGRLTGWRRRFGRLDAVEETADAADGEFAEAVDARVGLHADAGEAALLEEDWVAFLDYAQVGGRAQCLLHSLRRERVDHLHLHDAGAGRGLAGEWDAYAGGDNRRSSGGAFLRHGHALGAGPVGDLGELVAEADVRLAGVGGHHHVEGGVLGVEGGVRRGRERVARDERLGVANARGEAQDHGNVPALGDGECLGEAVVGLLGVAGFEDRRAGGDRVAAGVLLVLAGGHAGVIGHHDYQAAVHTGIGGCEERVGGDVEADVLHRCDDSGVSEGRANGHFEGDLLVRRPLGLAAEFGELLENFRGWGSGVSGSEVHARVKGRIGDGLVAVE